MASDLSAVRALTFDVFGTVVDWRRSVIAEVEAFGARKGVDADWTGFVDAWKGAYRPGMDRVNRNEVPWTTVEEIYRAKLEELLSDYGIPDAREEEKDRLNKVWQRLDPWPDSPAGLMRLKRRYILSTLSNGDFACLVNMAKHAGLPWDCILSSELVRRYKPDAGVYLMAIELLGLRPDEIMMVAAHNYDLAHAASHGMRTAFIPRPGEYGPGQTTDLEAEGDWDVVAGDLNELAGILGT